MKVKKIKKKDFSGSQIIFSSSREAYVLVLAILEAISFGDCQVEMGESRIKVLVECQTDVVGLHSREIGSA